MKKYMTYLFLGFLGIVLITFVMSLGDDAYLKTYYKGVWYKDVFSSIKYYILWVLPHWWLMMLIGSIVLGTLFYGVKVGIEKFTG